MKLEKALRRESKKNHRSKKMRIKDDICKKSKEKQKEKQLRRQRKEKELLLNVGEEGI